MGQQQRLSLNTQIYVEACEWFTECRSGDLTVGDREEFDRWLRRSPEHLSAYLEIAAIWNEGPSLDSTRKYAPDDLLASAIRDAENIVDFPKLLQTNEAISDSTDDDVGRPDVETGKIPVTTPSVASVPNLEANKQARQGLFLTERRFRVTRLRLGAVVISIAAVALGAVFFAWFDALGSTAYATAIGEQRSVQLDDGSTVTLNACSKIKVQYSRHNRDVELLEGQALFRVAKDVARPFIVRVGATKVRAVGTAFDVDQKRGATIVTVVEGRVAIVTDQQVADSKPAEVNAAGSDHANPSDSALLFDSKEAGGYGNILVSAGEQLAVTHHAIRKFDHPNIGGATAWTQGQIVFDFASLSDVADEFNRYNKRQLILEGSDLATFHVSGVFSSTDSASLIRFLKTRPGLRVVETRSEIRIEKKDS